MSRVEKILKQVNELSKRQERQLLSILDEMESLLVEYDLLVTKNIDSLHKKGDVINITSSDGGFEKEMIGTYMRGTSTNDKVKGTDLWMMSWIADNMVSGSLALSDDSVKADKKLTKEFLDLYAEYEEIEDDDDDEDDEAKKEDKKEVEEKDGKDLMVSLSDGRNVIMTATIDHLLSMSLHPDITKAAKQLAKDYDSGKDVVSAPVKSLKMFLELE